MGSKTKKILISIAAVIILAIGTTYTFLIGFITTSSVKPGVYTVYSTSPTSRIGSNVTAFNTGAHWVVVDTHLSVLAGKAKNAIKDISDQTITTAFNTHWHPDHSGGNAVFASEAKIFAHKNARKTLSSPQYATGLTSPNSQHRFAAIKPENLPQAITEQRSVYTIDGKTFQVVHYANAHTNGDLVINATDYGIINVGDLIWPGGFPFIDLDNGGNATGLLHALDNILLNASNESIFIAGHGAPLSLQKVKVYADMVRTTIQYVAQQDSAGHSLEEITKRGMPEKWKVWASSLVPESEWIRMVYLSLKKQ